MSDTELEKYETVVKPNYDNLSFEAPLGAAAQTPAEQRKQKGSHDIRLLTFVAIFLFVLVAVVLVLMSQGIIMRHDGGLVFHFRVSKPEDPFRISGEDHSQTEASESGKVNIDIADPPRIDTNPVESDGVLSVKAISEKVSPSVVAVLSTGLTGINSATGTIITENGYILTSAAAVRWANQILVVTDRGDRYSAQLVGLDVGTDVALLYVDEEDLPNAVFGNSDAMQVGETLVSISAETDSGVYLSVSSGIVSSIARDYVRGDSTMSLLRTNIAFVGGLAGTPVINSYGQVVGMLTDAVGGSTSGFSAAVAMNSVKSVIEAMVESSEDTIGNAAAQLGIEAVFLNETRATATGVPVGLLVSSVSTEGMFSGAGLAAGDVLIKVNDTRLTDMAAFLAVVKKLNTGDDAVMEVYRDTNPNDDTPGETLDLHFTVK